MQDVPLSDTTYERFRNLVYRRAGIFLGPNKQALLSARLRKRMRAVGVADFDAYYDYVRDDASQEEVVQLLDVVSTNVTQFYREARHFEVMADTLALWRTQGRRRFRLWCAAASTGEEPYTMAMTVCETLGPGADVKILATDISTRALDNARLGRYDNRRLAPVPPGLRDKYFVPCDAAARRAGDAIRGMVRFGRLNLAEPPFPMRGPLDMVMCRNVMIYFDQAVRQRLIAEIERLLAPEGVLFVGHAETLASIKTRLVAVSPSVYRFK